MPNEQRQDSDFVSPTSAAAELGLAKKQIDDWIEKYGGPGRLRFFETANGGQTRVSLADCKKLMDNCGIWPDGESPAGPDDSPEPQQSIKPELFDEASRYLYLIQQGGKTIETWSKEPREDEIGDNFGPGKYRVKKIDQANSGVVVKAWPVDVSASSPAAGNGDSIAPLLDNLKRIQDISSRSPQAHPPQQALDSSLLITMFNAQNTLLNTLLGALFKEKQQAPVTDPLEAIIRMKEAGIIDIGAGDGSGTVDLIMKALEMIAPVLAGGQAVAMPSHGPTYKYVPDKSPDINIRPVSNPPSQADPTIKTVRVKNEKGEGGQ